MFWPGPPRRSSPPISGRWPSLRGQLESESRFAPGKVGIAVRDLATGYTSGLNLDSVMPAASTIKVPVMVEVFRQMNQGRFDLHTPADAPGPRQRLGLGRPVRCVARAPGTASQVCCA